MATVLTSAVVVVNNGDNANYYDTSRKKKRKYNEMINSMSMSKPTTKNSRQ